MMIVPIYVIDVNEIDTELIINSNFFSNEEKTSLDKFKDEETRKEKIVSLYLKKKYVGDFSIDEHGKPLSENTFFNVSHSHGLVMLALSKECPIGIDLELVRPVEQKLINYVTSEEERKEIKEVKDFFKIWTSKESLLKAIGTGIDKKLDQVPSLPINGEKRYLNKTCVSKTVEYNKFIVSVTIEADEKIDFELEFERAK